MRSLLETQALLVRHTAALKLLGDVSPEKLLLMVVAPSPDALEASLRVAREQDAHKSMAVKVGRPAPPPKVVRAVRRTRPRVTHRSRDQYVTLDEILARRAGRVSRPPSQDHPH